MKKILHFGVMLCLLFQPALATAQNHSQEGTTIRVDVELVVRMVTVERKGMAISGIKQENWRACPTETTTKRSKKMKLEEQPKTPCANPEEIAFSNEFNRPPVNLLFIDDNSASARAHLNRFSKPAQRRFIRTISRTDDEFSVWTMNDKRSVVVPWTKDIETVRTGIASIEAVDNNTSLLDTLYYASEEMLGRDNENRRNMVIVVTDTFDQSRELKRKLIDSASGTPCTAASASCRTVGVDDLVTAFALSNTSIYIVDFAGRFSDKPQLRLSQEDLEFLTAMTGGRRLTAEKPNEAGEKFDKIAELFGKMYEVGFYLKKGNKGKEVILQVGETDEKGIFRPFDYDIWYTRQLGR
ncbi:MAG: VWA domain-containing protein [Patescibacteria group bacterium]